MSMPSAGSNRSVRASDRNITHRTWADGSFSVKYKWPDECRLKLDISPSTQMRAKRSSSSCLTLAVSAPTVKI
jgi:hypothetical protein